MEKYIIEALVSNVGLIDKLNNVGDMFISKTQTLSYFVFAGMGTVEIFKLVIAKKSNEVPAAIIKYLIAFGMFSAVPSLFKGIKSFFQGV